MLIVAGWFELPADRRDEYVERYQDLVKRAREADGCLDLAISADPVQAGRVNMYERWESEEHLNAWRQIADPPQLDVEFTGGDVQKHHVSHSEPPY
jgi:quinol monooxygenase YgiN